MVVLWDCYQNIHALDTTFFFFYSIVELLKALYVDKFTLRIQTFKLNGGVNKMHYINV